MSLADRVLYPDFLSRTMTADEAAALIPAGAHVGMSGFTGAGYPKAVPGALARRIESLNAQGHGFKIGLWTGASTCLLYTSPSPRDRQKSRMPSSA